MDFTGPQKDFYQQTFIDISSSGNVLDNKEFENCVFENCSFIESVFEKCKFIDCTFKQCGVSAVKLNASIFSEIQFYNSKVIGCDWTKAKNLRALGFEKSQLNYSNFELLKLPHLKLLDCMVKEVNFSGTDLTDGNFEGSDFEKSRFVHTNLTKANFKKAINYSIDFKLNILKKTVFSLPEAISLLDSLDIVFEN